MKREKLHMPKLAEAVDDTVLAAKARIVEAISPEAVSRFELCLTEALYNIVHHAETTADAATIDIELMIGDGKVAVDIYDPVGARHFDPQRHAPDISEIDPLDEGGRGLGLIMEYADVITYGPEEGRNRLHLGFSGR